MEACSNDSKSTYSQVILLNVLWQSRSEYLSPIWRAAPRNIKGESLKIWNHPFIMACRFHFVASVAHFNAPWTTCRLQLPILTKLFNPPSSRSFFISERTFQFTLVPSIANWICLDKSKPANPSSTFFRKSAAVACPRNNESR